MINKLIYLVILIVFFSCKNKKEENEFKNNLQIIDTIVKNGDGKLEKFVFKGSLKEYFKLGRSREGYFFPLNIVERNNKDTIKDVFLEYVFGVYLIRSNRLGLNIQLPLLPELNIQEEYSCSPSIIFDYYMNKFSNNLMFKNNNRYLEFEYQLLSKEQNSYQIFHKEIYQPNFETNPEITGLRVFTISLKEGTIEFETKDNFEQDWY
jgi:hypothetical protein